MVREFEEGLDLLIVSDTRYPLTKLLQRLTSKYPEEKFGVMVRSCDERSLIEPLGEAKPDWQIICELAQAMGGKGFQYKSAEEVFGEIARLTPIYAGITYPKFEGSRS